MRVVKLASAVGGSALMLCVLASVSAAQVTARQRAPIIRVYSENGAYVLETTSYVSPAIEVSENAYVFAVAMDLSGVIQVLHPDFPGISVRMLAHKDLRLPNFFAGFTQPSPGDPAYSSVAYSGYNGYDSGCPDSRGTVIALASRAPFNFDLIEAGGDWNISKIRLLIENRSPRVAAEALAMYLGAKGEPIGRDYMRFAGGRSYYYANSDYNSYSPYYSYSACDPYYGYGFASLRQALFFSQIQLLRRRGQSARIVGFDLCGTPIVVPSGPFVAGRFPVTKPPKGKGDTTSFPRARFPGQPMPRHPSQSAAEAAPLGVFPVSRSSLPQMGDVTIQSPRGRHTEPLQVFEGHRSQPGSVQVPQRHIPVDRAMPYTLSGTTGTEPPRAYRPEQPGTMTVPQGRVPVERTKPYSVPAATGTQPVRDYRPEPRVEAPTPTRVPERAIASPPPAPVVHERPAAPPPPPPRA
ncbi:MAG: hypothetical protein PVSMB1_06250 [Gemmatimonadaceae bacterium]